jgi:glycosyltransferase involved in cell wall biosynthesis
MTKPILSVLIDTYNHERYIEQAVISAIEQDFPSADYEIFVVDDGSTDRTPEIVRKFAPRVRLLRKKNGGQASAFNAALPELRGEIVAFLDGDDWFAPGKLTAVMNALEQHPEAAAVGHGHYEVHEEANEVRVRALHEAEFFHLATPEAAREAVRGWRYVLMGALTVRREILHRVTPIPEVLVFCGDGPIAMAALAGGTYVLSRPLFNYRHHPDSFHLADSKNMAIHRRMLEMIETTFEIMETTLIRLGVPPESAAALLYQDWTECRRLKLRTHGGSRLGAFRTEMRAFRSEHRNPTLSYWLFKYLCVGGATLLLPPPLFYRARDWYGQQNLGRFREQLARSR